MPKEIEKGWTNEIEQHTLEQISVAYGHELHLLLVRLSGLDIPLEKEIHTITECLDSKELDTFTTLILCENLKKKSRNKTMETVRFFAEKMLREPIVIDEAYDGAICEIKRVFNVADINQYLINRIKKLSEKTVIKSHS